MQPVEAATSPIRQVIITVHGIRTFGQWQQRLENLLPPRTDRVIFHYKYGYFSLVAFLVPPLRWLAVRRFSRELTHLSERYPQAIFDIVSHSFILSLGRFFGMTAAGQSKSAI
jgi:hypothetical protein